MCLTDQRQEVICKIADKNEDHFVWFYQMVVDTGFKNLHDFVVNATDDQAIAFFESYFDQKKKGPAVFDGGMRPYTNAKSKLYMITWIFRDGLTSRLDDITRKYKKAHNVSSGKSWAIVINEIRKQQARLRPRPGQWTWDGIYDFVWKGIEGSYRAISGKVIETMARDCLKTVLKENKATFKIEKGEVVIGGKAFDVVGVCNGKKFALPIKSRNTTGGGHGMLFTRDVDEAMRTANEHGYTGFPVIVAESWFTSEKEKQYEGHFEWIKRAPINFKDVRTEMLEVFRRNVDWFCA